MTFANVYNGKTVLVTGATGLIGSNLARRLATFEGIRLILMGRSADKLHSVFGDLVSKGVAMALAHDVSTPIPESVGAVDCVFHAAGPISGGVIRADPVSVINANLSGARNCLEYLVSQKRRTGRVGTMVVFSSATVYGNPVGVDRTCREDDTAVAEALDSVTAPYSESKRMVEVMARAYGRQYGVDVKIARFGYVYGPCAIHPETAFYEFVAKAKRGEDLVFAKSGFARRDNIHVDDAVAGLLCICERGATCEAYNVSSGGDGGNFAAIDELAERIAAAANDMNGTRVRVVCENTRRAPGLMMANGKLKALGWQIATPLAEGVRGLLG